MARGRVAHREQPIDGSGKMPRYWIFYDTETTPHRDANGVSLHVLQMGWAVYWDRENPDTQEWHFFTTIDEFWDFVHGHIPSAGEVPLNLVAHNAAFDLRVLQWYTNLFDRFGWSRGDLIILPDGSPLPFVVSLRRGRERVIFRDLANYYGLQPLARIGRSVGLNKQDDIVDYKKEAKRWFSAMPGSEDWETLKEYCKRDTLILLRAMDVLMAFLETNELGKLDISAASQSKRAFRKLMPLEADGRGAIYYHTEKARLALERDSYMGGRVEIFGKRGLVSGPIREFDFNSMYPSVQLNGLYPVRAVRNGWGYNRNRKIASDYITLDSVRNFISNDICIVARVNVRIPYGQRTHIPLKHAGKLLFPTGEFTTTLTTPELLHAFERGVVASVDEYSLYHGRRDLFKDYVEFFYQQRVNYKAEGNVAFEQLCKLFMNSLYGKFGQLSYEWEESDVPEGIVPPGTVMRIGEHTYRNFGNLTQRRSENKIEPANSFAAIAAHVTAYGRTILREAMDVVGPHVVYCDTDSLHVSGDAYKSLEDKGFIHNSRLGALKQEDHKGNNAASNWGVYRAPKDYELDGKEAKLKGVPKGSTELEPGVWLTEQFQGLSGAFRAGNLDAVFQRQVIKRRTDGYTKGFVFDDERIVPWHFSRGFQIDDPDFYLSRGVPDV